MNKELKAKETAVTNTPSLASKARKLTAWLPVFVLFGTFLVGFVPMWLKSDRLNNELFRALREARIEQIQITFANAALDARRGDYEPARQGMTSFFNLVTTELDRGIASALPAGAAGDLKLLLGQREELITLLARSDPASAERLANAYASFRQMLGR